LVYVMGPSGAGKDTLMAEARRRLPDRLVLAERLVTRPVVAGSLDRHVTEERMARLARCGRLALHWSCHGFGYGIEKAVDDSLRRGMAVLVNGSRGYFRRALAVYPALVPILITAEPGILRARLEGRAREGPGSISERLLRIDEGFDLAHEGLLTIDNSCGLEGAVELFLGHIRGRSASG
jgi:ribose 1,5-bisphosphokinase